ncbi:Wzy polymerase domain-containing protein [Marinobacter sp. S0848L]|uniref:PglL family O-oligosaccharyltransferase n=1 Tax=Marinobacter sp. S0848L TaxID=2926423 RepID=UPI001FF5A06B|nr:Wzy polymerase domain-containing protein [Marinobacter sp. S0848L]MCK0107109.1 Wzy polymerase domain-containing protein [Marinobacter sp. S0848L]
MRGNAMRMFCVLIFGLAITPLAGVVAVWPVNSALINAGVFLFSGLLVGSGFFVSKDASFKVSMPVVFCIALLALLIVSVFINSYSFEASWRWYFVSLTFSVFVILSASEVKSQNPIEFNFLLARALMYGSFIYCLASIAKFYGILSYFLPWVEASYGRLSGLMNQPNLTTAVAWFGLIAGSVVYSGSNRKFLILNIVVLGWVIASSASRMSWLILFGLFVFVLLSRLPRFDAVDAHSTRKNLSYGLLAVFLMLLVVPQINSLFRNHLVEVNWIERNIDVALIDRSVTQDDARISEFLKLTSGVSQFSLRQLLVGVGPGNYPNFSYSADMSLPSNGVAASTWLHSHNLFTMVFVEFGVFGLVLILIGICYIVKVALSKPMDSSRFVAIGGLGVVFVHSNLEFPLWYPWFLIMTCLLMVSLFDVKSLYAETKHLKPILGSIITIMAVALVINLSAQYGRIVKVAVTPDPDREQLASLSLLANDSLMGPYAILRKYRDFAPETTNLDWQLNEARRMKLWQPRDLVVLREYSILVLKGDVNEACQVAESIAYRYPAAAPIMLDHALKSVVLKPQETIVLAKCIERGLAPRGETIPSMQSKNQDALSRM